mmetsp:Transcript_7781/g.11032  ORF Transcript_7781/g.11032 Transcript_7781/m.11032 type:complete len:109 (+) Transcript_7781:971-1297(+)
MVNEKFLFDKYCSKLLHTTSTCIQNSIDSPSNIKSSNPFTTYYYNGRDYDIGASVVDASVEVVAAAAVLVEGGTVSAIGSSLVGAADSEVLLASSVGLNAFLPPYIKI